MTGFVLEWGSVSSFPGFPSFPPDMLIRHLSLTNFRNLQRLEADIPAGTLLLVGANAQGKTSLLEAIYYLTAASSPHATTDRQLINFGALREEPKPFARIVAEVRSQHELKRIEIRLIDEPVSPAAGPDRETRFKKEIYVNGLRKRVGDLGGQFNAVMFLPHEMGVIEGSPAARRRYLDAALSQVDRAYADALSGYGKVITQRNALLKLLQESGGDQGQLDFWDEQLVAHGALIIRARAAALDELERLAAPIHRALTRGAEVLRLVYRPSFDPAAPPLRQITLPMDIPVERGGIPLDEIRAGLLSRLREKRAEEIARGLTTVGPQRDEVRFLASGLDLGTYGSRGQVRTALLSLKLAETAWIKRKVGEWPVLLLDEIMAELDANHRADLLTRINGSEQAVLTTTDPGLFTESFRQNARIWTIEAGMVTEEE